MKRKYFILAVWVGATVLLSPPIFKPVQSVASVVWSDNFNDGNYDGWTVYGINSYKYGRSVRTEGSFSAADGTLRATGEPTDEGNLWNYIEHPSTVAWGTWSFDVYITDTPGHHFYVWFMINDWASFPLSAYGYDIALFRREYALWKRAGDLAWGGTIVLDSVRIGLDQVYGWKHIDVTRDADGQFFVYINGTLLLEKVDTEITTSTHFRFGTEAGPALDNVVVSNTVDITPALATPEWLTISIGVPVVLVVIGAVWKWKLRRVS